MRRILTWLNTTQPRPVQVLLFLAGFAGGLALVLWLGGLIG